jgi:hypothetical protein
MQKKKNNKNGSESRYVFWGLFLLSTGLLFLFINAEILPYKITQLWPLVVFFCGGALLCSGLYRRKRLGVSYLVPAAMLMSLSLFFLLFSLRIITQNFVVFVAKWWPISLIAAGIALVILFFNRRQAILVLSTVVVDDGDSFDDIVDALEDEDKD